METEFSVVQNERTICSKHYFFFIPILTTASSNNKSSDIVYPTVQQKMSYVLYACICDKGFYDASPGESLEDIKL